MRCSAVLSVHPWNAIAPFSGSEELNDVVFTGSGKARLEAAWAQLLLAAD